MSIRRNSFYNLAGSLAPILVTLFTVPPYLRLIGVERYGVLVIVWVFLGYFGVFDLGLGRATAQRIAALRYAKAEERAETFWTAIALNMTFGVVGGTLLWPIARYFFAVHFNIPAGLRPEVLAVVPWMAIAVPVVTVSGVLSGALQGRERFLARNVSSVTGAVLYQIFPLGVAWFHGPDLAWLVPAALFGRIVVLLMMFGQCYFCVPLDLAISIKREVVATLFRYGSWVTVTSAISPLLTALDRIIIGSIGSAKAVTYYTIPFNLASRITILPASLADTLFPRFSSSSEEDQRRLMHEAVCALRVVLTPLIIGGIVIMGPFLGWWVGEEVARRASFVGEIIAIGLWFNGQAYIPFARLQAHGRPDVVAKCHFAEMIPYLVFLIIALRMWGVVGAALAWCIRSTVDAVLLFWLAGLGPRGLISHRYPLLLLGVAIVSVLFFPLGSISRWGVGLTALVGSVAWAWWEAPDSVRELAREGYQMLAYTGASDH